MKTSLPILAALALLATLCWQRGLVVLGDDPTATPEAATPATPAAAVPEADDATVDGRAILQQALRSLPKLPPLEANLRQRVDLFGQQLVGAGTYLQAGDGNDLRFRWDLKLQVLNQVTSLQQVCDGQYLWLRREAVDKTTLSRVNLRRVNLRRVQETRRAGADEAGATLGGALSGGLLRLLERLDADWQFNPARAANWGDVPVWELSGTWRPERIAGHKKLPAHLPDRVRVVLGRSEPVVGFPFRIEYQRQTSGTPRSLVTLDLFEIRRVEIDPRSIRYEPTEQELQGLIDLTDVHVQRVATELELRRAEK